MKTEKELWALIEKADWKKDHDYNRIRKEFTALPKDTYSQLMNFIDKKHGELYERFKNDWLASPGIRCSDDGWSDLIAEVVGRGEKFFKAITVSKLQKMAIELDYEESFVYVLK